jgi:hypothetical protein
MVGMMHSLLVLYERRRIVAYLDGLYPDGHLRQAKVNALREVQSATGEELSALMRAFWIRHIKVNYDLVIVKDTVK